MVVAAGDVRTALLLALAATLQGSFVVHAILRQDLYPHDGIGSSLLELNAEGQLESVEVNLKTPITFYESIYETVFVNGNGVLSFLAPMERFFNIPFPLDYPIISPLYTHVDTRGSGSVHWWETDAPDVISKAGDTIRRVFKSGKDFYPSHVFIATWKDVGYYSEKSDKINTYQVAISSNGSHSFAEFLYPDEGVQWIQADFHPSGLPDAKAQAGVVARDGRMYTFKGSGTDQIQNIDKWSNVNNPGQWVIGIGPIPDSANVQLPDNIEDAPANNEIPSCLTGATSCHSRAECIDYSEGFCCLCKTGFFGNGKFCQQNDLPLRVTGKVFGFVNGQDFPAKDLQCYVQTKDGRTYTAISKVPEIIGSKSQLLSNLGGALGWLFARSIENTKNGYQLTGGVFNMTADIVFTNTGDKITIRSRYLGLDVFGQLKMEAEIRGSLPEMAEDARVEYEDHEELYTKTQPGTILSQSSRSYKLIGDTPEVDYPFTQSIVINYQRCEYAPDDGKEDTVRLKFSRGLTSYEAREQIIRFAMNTKVAPLEEEDPCIQGRTHCGDHSSCIVEGDSYKCVCNPGYQFLYEDDGSANCVDVNECTAGTHLCSPDASCINNEGSHLCQCLEGFYGDGRTCGKMPSCDDTDCGAYAECNMVEGTPVCSCSSGFEQTEEGCYPVRELICDDKVCSPYAYCAEDAARGTSECVCVSGFVGNGYNCEPDFETASSTVSYQTEQPPTPQCILNQCWCPSEDGWKYQDDSCVKINPEDGSVTDGYNRPETSTTEQEGSSDLSARPVPECLQETGDCICPWGYAYDRRRDICVPQPGYNHETMGPSGSRLSCNVMNICHPYAQCVFVPDNKDRYECQCNVGYDGDGYECRKTEITCLEVDICDPNAACRQEEPTGAKCVCNPGFEGDGSTCTPIDACSQDADCGQNQFCAYNLETSRYFCSCSPGYQRVDDVCVVTDCSTNPSECHLHAQCVTSPTGGYMCVCLPGYNGDGVRICREDHVGCNIINNCGENAVCGYQQATGSYACECKAGYYWDGFNCLPESSCKTDPRLCSADATCVPAGENRFACVCNAGFAGDGVECKIIPRYDSNILLVNQGTANLRIPFFPTPDHPGSLIFIDFKQMAIGLDIDCVNGRAYWSDITGHQIRSMTYNGSDSKVFIGDVGGSEGLAIDWISRNIFWTDSNKRTIEVANLESMKRKVLFVEGLTNPRGIAAHPYRGKIFWSDWNRESPKIEWSNEDGSERGIFLQNEHVKVPNSLAIDWSTDELCWGDAGLFVISCANIDTRSIRVVATELSYPFGLAISQNHYYWTDWNTQKIEIASKNSGERNKPLEIPLGGSDKLFGIVAVPEFCPEVSNVCQYEFGRCNEDQLCLPDGQGGRTCACADNASGPCTNEYQSS
ncbi:nidogen isoform X1 [Athalia rosae]|uniref:nidogen isoform X1 n=1 Tax=Athalia rosae TaxID=37344 RepID=UPI002033E299|nr:nidogen isoform X1 [Athalia rosae]